MTSAAPLSPWRLVAVAVATQAGLVALAIAAGRLLDVPVVWGPAVPGILAGLVAAGLLALANFALLQSGRRGGPGRGIWEAFRDVLVPLFGRGSLAGSLIIGAAAGIGEEWFFRGFLQPLVGWLGASVIFGAAHVGGRRLLTLGAWASLMGMVLGGLAIWSGGLVAPVVAHGAYDALALEYIRRTAGAVPGLRSSEEQVTT